MEGKGSIKIYSQVIGNAVELVIEDNGIGFEKSKKQSMSKMGGVGIQNVKKRIQFYYGENYGVFVEEGVSEGARVIVRLPYPKV